MSYLKNKKLAIVGGTGLVGLEFLKILEEKKIPIENISVLASSKSEGKKIPYTDKTLEVINLEKFDFSSCQIALFSPGASISQIFVPKAAENGALVIDNTSFFRMHEDVPLVVPEVNGREIKNARKRIIANPNCSTIQLVMALKPIHDLSNIVRVVASTYQSVSGAGMKAIREWNNQNQGGKCVEFLNHKIADNVIPHIDVFLEQGFTKEEWKMDVETKKIIGCNVNVSATCVRVPVKVAHCVSANVELEEEIPIEKIYEKMKGFPGLKVSNLRSLKYHTPLDVAGRDEVFVSRLRRDPSNNKAYNMWIVADNIRKGAALNAIQIAEIAVEMNVV